MSTEDMERRLHWLRLARELGAEDDFRALMDDLKREGAEEARKRGGGRLVSDLVEWLTKILDEDEVAAKAAGEDGLRWRPREFPYEGISFYVDPDVDGYETSETIHIERHDPAAALADIAAKRAIIALHARAHECTIGSSQSHLHEDGEACETLHLLATAYASRPGYHFNGWQT